MIKKIAASVLLKISMVKAYSSTSSVSEKGYFQPKEPEAITKLRNRNVSRNK